MRGAKLTPRRERFCAEYLIDRDASKAARRAGYKPRHAGQVGYQLLQKTSIRARIDALEAARSVRTLITADRVLREAARLAFADIRHLYREDGTLKPVHELDDATAATVQTVETVEVEGVGRVRKVKQHSKVQALDKLMRHLGLYREAAPAADHATGHAPATAEQLAAAERTAQEALARLSADGGGQPVDDPPPAPAADGVPAAGRRP